MFYVVTVNNYGETLRSEYELWQKASAAFDTAKAREGMAFVQLGGVGTTLVAAQFMHDCVTLDKRFPIIKPGEGITKGDDLFLDPAKEVQS